MKINNLLVSEGVRYIFCNTFLGHPDIFENFLEHVCQCNFDLPLGTTFLNKVLKLWVENALVLMNISKEFWKYRKKYREKWKNSENIEL